MENQILEEMREETEEREETVEPSKERTTQGRITLLPAERKQQRKISQFLHYELNKRGIKAQLKGDCTSHAEAIIGLPNGLWLFIGYDHGFYYKVDEERHGDSYLDGMWWEDMGELLRELPEIISERAGNTAPRPAQHTLTDYAEVEE